MKTQLALASTFVLVLAACDEPASNSSAQVDPLTAALAGKTLVLGQSTFKVARNGALTGSLEDGTKFVGAWAVRDGKWCNQFSEPEGFQDTVCQKAVLNGDGTVTIDSRRGGSNVWTIQ